MVYNVHVRRLTVAAEAAAGLIDSLGTGEDRLWPVDCWPPMRFDRPLGVGASGGHGPVRYYVESYVPGRFLRCRFTAPRGVAGFHEYEVIPRSEDECDLRHVLSGSLTGPALLTFPLFFRPAHDAVLEDSLDRAELSVTGTVRTPARWTPYVRALRLFAAGRAQLGTAVRRPS
ncbi:SRPBCC family protein [Amycolatopsis sp. H20-H5]|uniref:SRPBCC family protein n=1 Tax=Amycolatopsis sp. H20-H5 TaxID=3046309 RepID=UPI002DBCE4B8|nr:SRPBCC family protein [Amycolatopsis sp. H20-H5]MEC3976307.1 SRPBCC family protein [Amycolatopsis sp. H20-H5]